MVIDESLSNIERTVKHLTNNDPAFEAKPPIVATPQWWIDELALFCKDKMVEATDQVESVHGCRVMLQEALEEPFVISGGGKIYPVLPGWARAANVGKSSVKAVDSIFSIEPEKKS